MICQPPIATRTYTLFPYPTLYRSQAHPAPLLAQALNCQRRHPTNRRKRPFVATVISSRRYPPAATKRLSTMQRRYVPACIYREELGQINNTRWRKSADHQEQLWLIALVFLILKAIGVHFENA